MMSHAGIGHVPLSALTLAGSPRPTRRRDEADPVSRSPRETESVSTHEQTPGKAGPWRDSAAVTLAA
ncbi:hypothetical protein ACH4LN_25170 [Streptomyces albus]|uniref:Uncharacterized protein n=1 Tax=Streptomyces albus TaxID=1888 RepID=A0A6C1BXT6_9ACTN|nr:MULTISPECIES: hypothetical protein [Streptomyces]EPD96932.1 hypothetical protein HMPREF1486_00542 [Streptomyces sp. HPH0547]QID35029.1 hypothetical protein G3260_000925 [Streptomyces albus]TGG76310.1 hypothetical protein D8771_30370 [Streptomyces albus]UVN58168.1 hypothetical protein NR995_29305 [Streptomyces albus]GHJ20741.1 hypothetical protein TPA0909_23550 [Streptomyces albus]